MGRDDWLKCTAATAGSGGESLCHQRLALVLPSQDVSCASEGLVVLPSLAPTAFFRRILQ
jgi:hypothetical protein